MFVKDKLIKQTNAGNVSSKKCYGPFLTLSVNNNKEDMFPNAT